ncbi:hypothetical protein IBX73_07450 [candidate division WOR-3 bacterium]|nr:hypothetical protein [candidate division WOR-3 bacterium]
MRIQKVISALAIILLVHSCSGRKEEPGALANNPPVLQNVTLLPAKPTVQSEITARILASDRDGDPITFEVKWFVNDFMIGEGMSLSSSEIKKGDRIFAEVTPYDGKTYGAIMRSGEITIGGFQPRILSVSVMPEIIYVTTPRITLNALFEDADNDNIDLIVHWLVNDEVLDNTSNVLPLAPLGLKKNDVITGAAFVDDGEHRSEAFPFEITIANSPPAFRTRIDSVRTSNERVYYTVPIYDPDDDPLTFELLQAPDGIMIDADQGIIYGAASGTAVFEIHVRATDAEGAYLDAKFTLASK